MEMNQLRVLVFLLVFLRMRCLASDNVMCLTKRCMAVAAAAKQREHDQQITSTSSTSEGPLTFEDPFTEDPATEDSTTEILTTENPLYRINFQPGQTERINRFAKEVLFVSERISSIICSYFLTLFL